MQYSIRGTYTCKANESWDWIALMFYHDEKYTPDLMNANPEYCGRMTFQGGERILIPYIEQTENEEEAQYANTVAPWKE